MGTADKHTIVTTAGGLWEASLKERERRWVVSAIMTFAKLGCGCGKRVKVMCDSGWGILLEGVRWIWDLGCGRRTLNHCYIREARCTLCLAQAPGLVARIWPIPCRGIIFGRKVGLEETKCLCTPEVGKGLACGAGLQP